MFAKAKGSKRPYFAVLDTNDQDNVKQVECWSAIPVPDGVDYILHGTHRYINDDLSIDHILLFVTDSRDSDTSKFYLLRYVSGMTSRGISALVLTIFWMKVVRLKSLMLSILGYALSA